MSRVLAARISSSNGSSESMSSSTDSAQSGRPKRTLIESACQHCRRRKSRCDGLRPSCTRCQALEAACIYDAEEGESRWSVLRRRNELLVTERAEVRELFGYLQAQPELEAQDIFNRIRSGGYDEIFTLLRQIRDSGQTSDHQALYLPPLQVHVLAADEQRLPPIRTLFDVAGSQPSTLGINMSIAQAGMALAAEFGESSRGSTSSSACSSDPPVVTSNP